jgi:hypothetical protein
MFAKEQEQGVPVPPDVLERLKKQFGQYSEDQPRDERGRWTEGGGAAVALDRSRPFLERRAAWSKIPRAERDRIAHAEKSIGEYQRQILAPAGAWKSSGDMNLDVSSRVDTMKSELNPQSAALIKSTMTGYMRTLEEAGVSPERARPRRTHRPEHRGAEPFPR